MYANVNQIVAEISVSREDSWVWNRKIEILTWYLVYIYYLKFLSSEAQIRQNK